MGVPVVTLAGRTAVSRAGVSILSNVGLPELIAETIGTLRGPYPRMGRGPRAAGPGAIGITGADALLGAHGRPAVCGGY